MIKLNILPRERKKTLKDKRFFEMASKKAFFLLSIIFFYAILVTAENLYLKYEIDLSDNLIANFSKKDDGIDKTIQDVNKKINYIDDTHKNMVNWFVFFGDIKDMKPDGIKINKISLSKQGNKIAIAGFAATRDELVAFSDKLKSSARFSEIDLPFTALLSQKNITFEIKANIKNYESKKSQQN